MIARYCAMKEKKFRNEGIPKKVLVQCFDKMIVTS